MEIGSSGISLKQLDAIYGIADTDENGRLTVDEINNNAHIFQSIPGLKNVIDKIESKDGDSDTGFIDNQREVDFFKTWSKYDSNPQNGKAREGISKAGFAAFIDACDGGNTLQHTPYWEKQIRMAAHNLLEEDLEGVDFNTLASNSAEVVVPESTPDMRQLTFHDMNQLAKNGMLDQGTLDNCKKVFGEKFGTDGYDIENPLIWHLANDEADDKEVLNKIALMTDEEITAYKNAVTNSNFDEIALYDNYATDLETYNLEIAGDPATDGNGNFKSMTGAQFLKMLYTVENWEDYGNLSDEEKLIFDRCFDENGKSLSLVEAYEQFRNAAGEDGTLKSNELETINVFDDARVARIKDKLFGDDLSAKELNYTEEARLTQYDKTLIATYVDATPDDGSVALSEFELFSILNSQEKIDALYAKDKTEWTEAENKFVEIFGTRDEFNQNFLNHVASPVQERTGETVMSIREFNALESMTPEHLEAFKKMYGNGTLTSAYTDYIKNYATRELEEQNPNSVANVTAGFLTGKSNLQALHDKINDTEYGVFFDDSEYKELKEVDDNGNGILEEQEMNGYVDWIPFN